MKKEENKIIPSWYWSVCKNTLSYIKIRKHIKEDWKRYFIRMNEPQNKEVLKEVFLNKRILNFAEENYPKELKKLQKEVLK